VHRLPVIIIQHRRRLEEKKKENDKKKRKERMPRASATFFTLLHIPVAIFGLLSRIYRNTYPPLPVKQGVTFAPAAEV
jgi:cell division septal protein FtsQ